MKESNPTEQIRIALSPLAKTLTKAAKYFDEIVLRIPLGREIDAKEIKAVLGGAKPLGRKSEKIFKPKSKNENYHEPR